MVGRGEGRRLVPCGIDVFQISTQTRGDGMIIGDWSGDNLKRMGASCGQALNKVFGQERVGRLLNVVDSAELEERGRQSCQGQKNDKITLR